MLAPKLKFIFPMKILSFCIHYSRLGPQPMAVPFSRGQIWDTWQTCLLLRKHVRHDCSDQKTDGKAENLEYTIDLQKIHRPNSTNPTYKSDHFVLKLRTYWLAISALEVSRFSCSRVGPQVSKFLNYRYRQILVSGLSHGLECLCQWCFLYFQSWEAADRWLRFLGSHQP